MQMEATAKVTFDGILLNELASLCFLDAQGAVTIVGPVGVGKPFSRVTSGHISRAGARRPHRLGAQNAQGRATG